MSSIDVTAMQWERIKIFEKNMTKVLSHSMAIKIILHFINTSSRYS